MALLELKSVTLSLGGPSVLDQVDLGVEKGERICLLGRNGEGKTTLLRLLAGRCARTPARSSVAPEWASAPAAGGSGRPGRTRARGGGNRPVRPGRTGDRRGLATGAPGRDHPRTGRPGRKGRVRGALDGQQAARAAGARSPANLRCCCSTGRPTTSISMLSPGSAGSAAPVRGPAVLRHTRPRVPARHARARDRVVPRPPARADLRLRHFPASPRRDPRGRAGPVGRIRPQAGRGGSVDPPGRGGNVAPGTKAVCAR
ncbi:MAG: ATP-binding cassette domain-containing protein [bacterium]|nr:ATP-binding cassette domain-containing protein [bacterium]